ncbi:hypothetical protein IW261DRAFT_1335283 [Armillaria novae-zelandiae]|uniref:Uncharacterized protein n=1 Tax=Armillaria novae-zelandiae TaxID=153914 RepID=A0AA39UG09_9AGAR|nr:hypothetical protein IW261DRAFT_1335283 [Armillaria novae-zelandiae]
MPVKSSDILLIIVAILFPPAAAFFVSGCGADLLINFLLTLIGAFPGHIHAFWLIYKKIKAEEMYGPGGYEYAGYGYYQPVPNSAPYQAPPSYGATNA